MDFLSLREKYPRFSYEGYNIAESPESIKVIYHFSIEGLADFHPSWTIPQTKKWQNYDENIINNFVFNLGLVELVSYWKLTCSPDVYVKAGLLSDEQITWWKKLYYLGLGEFFYINNIQTDIDVFMTIHSDGIQHATRNSENRPLINLSGNLIPVGGGKDSIVSLDLLKSCKQSNMCYIMNETKARLGTAYTAGYSREQIAVVYRTLDSSMLELNRKKFLNGHTPLSALIAFSSVLVAYLNGKEYVVLSNESSANDLTITEAEVNHQYSKSYQFEFDFNSYLSSYMNYGIKYFSLLRPFCELQIAEHFSHLIPFHPVFNSCNLGSKFDGWCLKCSKCLFIYIILSPFLSQSRLQQILGDDLLNREDFLDDFEKLTGLQENKPFECVGSREEVNTAIILTIDKMKAENEEIPFLFKKYINSPLFALYCEKAFNYSQHFDAENLIPQKFENFIETSGMYVS